MSKSDKNSINTWQKIAYRVFLNHPRLTVLEDEVRLPSGKTINYLRHENKGYGGVILICLKDEKILV